MEYHQPQACTIIKNKNVVIALLAAAVLLSSGCASTPKEENQVYDPYEGVNRKIYKFNDALDRNILKPVADTYVKVTPEIGRAHV